MAQDASCLYLLEELVEGVELYEYLSDVRRVEGALAVNIGAQMVLAFEYLHGRSVIYRDLKSENVIINRDGFVKLTDFGQAKVVHGLTYSLCGTPEYLAPEVILAMGHSKPADWWTLGVLLY